MALEPSAPLFWENGVLSVANSSYGFASFPAFQDPVMMVSLTSKNGSVNPLYPRFIPDIGAGAEIGYCQADSLDQC